MRTGTDVRSRKRAGRWRLLAVILLAGFAWYLLGRGPSLDLWHTEVLTEEFSVEASPQVKTFEHYLELEARLFSEMDRKIYDQVDSGPNHKFNRFSSGSKADPRQYEVNWNRSFELTAEVPVGGVLLLHGMSDAPYSLRSMAERLNREGYQVIGLRLPGHGTIPSGLKRVQWEDMAEAVRLALTHLDSRAGSLPIHLVGYSNGAALAINGVLDALKREESSVPASLILISPAVGIHPAAGLTRIKEWLSRLPGLEHFAWLSVEPEFDPYKYNSFAVNGGIQVHRLTRHVARRIAGRAKHSDLKAFPPVLVLKSTVDATVSTTAVVNDLLIPLGPGDHELVLFDINRFAAESMLLVSDPGPLTARLAADDSLPFSLTLVVNQGEKSRKVEIKQKRPHSVVYRQKGTLTLPGPKASFPCPMSHCRFHPKIRCTDAAIREGKPFTLDNWVSRGNTGY